MALVRTHELHTRRFSRNAGVAIALVLFAGVVFGITVVKIAGGDRMEGFDHQPRASVLPPAPAAGGTTP